MPSILVAEDNKILREGIYQALCEKGMDVCAAEDGEVAIGLLKEKKFALVISDFRLPKLTGMDILRHIHDTSPDTMVILITAYGTIEVAVEAMKLGAFDFIQKPFSIEELEFKTEKALKHREMTNEIDYLRHERKVIYKNENIIGKSPAIKAVFSTISKVAQANVTVVINGETGTGKELVAGAIHYSGCRAKKSFVKVNCAAIPDELLESELFGHEKGAFTGAEKQRIGRFEQADGGTIFLDEIGDMSHKTQAKVLRVLQEQEFERVGGTKTVKVNVRVLTATNKDLKNMVEDGEFREDLYYRLNVVHIWVPPLRERGDDVIEMAEYFLRKYKMELGKKISVFSDSALALLRSYPWPGNVRELNNSVERAVLMAEKEIIEAADFDISFKREVKPSSNVEKKLIELPAEGVSLQQVEKCLIIQALERSNWVQKEAAKLLGLSRRVMHYKIEIHGIKNDKWIKNK